MGIVTLLFLLAMSGWAWHEARWAEREVSRAQTERVAKHVQSELDKAA
jgi:hypothetical protein